MTKYQLTDEHRVKLSEYADKWRAISRRTGDYTAEQLDALPGVLRPLYERLGWEPTERVVVVDSPRIAALVARIAGGVWWLREHPEAHAAVAGRQLTEADYAAAIGPACRAVLLGEPIRAHADAAAAVDTAADAAAADARGGVASWLCRVVARTWWYHGRSNLSPYHCVYVGFFRDVAGIQSAALDAHKIYERACEYGPRRLHPRFAVVTRYPKVMVVADDRLHCEVGPALQWRGEEPLYYWHGTQVPGEWIERKSTVDPSLALTWKNIEQRRCLAEILGWARVLEKMSPRVIDADKDPMIGTLVEVDLPDSPGERFLRVQCGTGREFAMGVDPKCQTALEAQAWLAGFDDVKEFAKPEVRT